MAYRIGVLLPRSTDYPAIGWDILEGIKSGYQQYSFETIEWITESIGFGEDASVNYAMAEKLLLQEAVDAVIVYSNASNALPLYPLAGIVGKPFIFLDAGMQQHEAVSAYCYHISLQGIHACRIAGNMAGEGERKVLMASSFYDGGYRGPWAYDIGLSESGGSICGNYVSGYLAKEFTIDPYIGLLQHSGASSVAACFSSYLAKLFMRELNQRNGEAIPLPFYCSPFMAEEQLLRDCDFPGGDFYTVVPWGTGLVNDEQLLLNAACRKNNKVPNIFHLLGWEAAIVLLQALRNGPSSPDGFKYASPRGEVTIHPVTHFSYAPLYKGKITAAGNGKCQLQMGEMISISAADHEKIMNHRPQSVVSGWRNNYLCI